MTTPSLPGLFRTGVCRTLMLLAVGLMFLTAAADSRAQSLEAKSAFNVPAGEAKPTLRQFATQAKREIVIAVEAVDGIRTRAVQGEFTPREAIERMLVGTGLVATQDAKTGAFAVRREKREESKNVPIRRADDAAEPARKTTGQVQDGVLQLEKVEVTGSHIRSIAGEQTASPMLTWNRDDIDRSGVTSLSDLRNLIPQLSVGASTQFDGNSSGSAPDGRLLFNLRGVTGNNTLVLVDGRRLPKTGQRGVAEAYEATGIPLSAIERVEVLLDGGSAIYGADAIGGVVNIILKKKYTGTELTFDYDNTFDKDAANRRVSLTSAVARGKWDARVFLSYEKQNALARRDRWWLRSDDRRYLGGSNGTANNFPIGGRVLAVSGVLPGIGASTAYIPANSNGRNLTIADFANASATPLYDSGEVQNAMNEFDRTNLSAHVGYEHRPWARFRADYAFGRNRSYGLDSPVALNSASSPFNPLVNTVLPANYPGNPFGVPIRVQKYFWDLGPLNRRYLMDTFSASIGVDGELPRDWHYDITGAWTKSTPGTLDQLFQFDAQKLTALMQSANPPVLLHNSLNGPANPDGTLEAAFFTGANREFPQTYTYSINTTGPIWDLPSGAIQVAVGTEMREEYIEFNRENFAAATESAQPNGHRTVKAIYGEVSVPLVTPKWQRRIPLVHTLVVGAAGRADDYNDFGGATKPRYTAQYRPVKWLMLRGSHSEAFKAPLLVELSRPQNTGILNVPATGTNAIIDHYRNNEPFIGPIQNTTGGNPGLRPENSGSRNYGVILEAPFKILKGFSASIDWWDIRITDRVGNLTFQDRLEFFPEMFTRAALTPADQAAGLTFGRLTGVDNRSVNIALYHTAGADYSLRYDRSTAWGNFRLKASLTQTDKVEVRTRPGAPASTSVSAITRPKRGVGTLSWTKSGLGASVTAIWQDRWRTSALSTITFPQVTLWNCNVWYDFNVGTLHGSNRWVGRILKDTRISAGLINALDQEPDLTPTGGLSGAIDPRLRRYTLTVRKRF